MTSTLVAGGDLAQFSLPSWTMCGAELQRLVEASVNLQVMVGKNQYKLIPKRFSSVWRTGTLTVVVVKNLYH